MSRRFGTKVYYSPGQTARYRSQWLRYQKALQLSVEKVSDEEYHVFAGPPRVKPPKPRHRLVPPVLIRPPQPRGKGSGHGYQPRGQFPSGGKDKLKGPRGSSGSIPKARPKRFGIGKPAFMNAPRPRKFWVVNDNGSFSPFHGPYPPPTFPPSTPPGEPPVSYGLWRVYYEHSFQTNLSDTAFLSDWQYLGGYRSDYSIEFTFDPPFVPPPDPDLVSFEDSGRTFWRVLDETGQTRRNSTYPNGGVYAASTRVVTRVNSNPGATDGSGRIVEIVSFSERFEQLLILPAGQSPNLPPATPPSGQPILVVGVPPHSSRFICNCPDYSRKLSPSGSYRSEMVSRDWSSSNAGSGRVGNEQQPCKHILAVKHYLGIPVDVHPQDWREMEEWKHYVRFKLKRRKRKHSDDHYTNAYQRWQRRIERMGYPSAQERAYWKKQRQQRNAQLKPRLRFQRSADYSD